MVAKGPVSIKEQTIFALIPYVDIWAFYRIQKLRRMILFSLILGLGFVPIYLLVLLSIDKTSMTEPLDIYSNSLFIVYLIGSSLAGVSLKVYLIRKWSKKWNDNILKNYVPSEKTDKKIIFGTTVGLGVLIVIIWLIIVSATPELFSPPLTDEIEFGYYQMADKIKHGELWVSVTSEMRPGLTSNPSDKKTVLVTINVENRNSEKTNSFMLDQFVIIDSTGREFSTVYISSDEFFDLKGFENIPPGSRIARVVGFDMWVDPSMKYDFKLEDGLMVCLRNC